MDRREFLKTGAKAAAAGAAVSIPTHSSLAGNTPAAKTPVGDPGISVVMKDFTVEDHRRRLLNIGICTQKIRKCMRKHLITNYLPAHCTYNLGEYPCVKPWEPGEADERELDRLKNHGVQVIQVFDEWSDALRLFGGDKHTPLNPAGYRRFVDMVHNRGMKILTYASSGYFEFTNPDFRSEWARPGDVCTGGWWKMSRCVPGSPGWRAYLLPRIINILEEHGVDGIYNDWGYRPNAHKQKVHTPAKDEIAAFEETDTHDGAVTDLLALIYAEVKRRGGIVKVHADRDRQPQTDGLKVYDYLWVGENVANADGLREAAKNHQPYVIPCMHLSQAKIDADDDPFLHTIPYLQFPILPGGLPFTGERGAIPGIEYGEPPTLGWSGFCKKVREYHKAHPNGPHVYSGWDPVPPRPESRATHARWLKQYRPLVEEGTWAFLEIGDSDLFAKPLPEDCVASAFANRDLFVVLANYGQSPQQIETAETYLPTDTPSAAPAKHWQLPKRSLRIIKRSV